MIRQYVNTGRGRRVTISPVVPGAQYRITAWALGDGRRSAAPAVEDVTTREAGWSCLLYLCTDTYVYTVQPTCNFYRYTYVRTYIYTYIHFIRMYIHTYSNMYVLCMKCTLTHDWSLFCTCEGGRTLCG